MSQQRTAKAPVTFCDVAAYFSDEEWKLLYEWQKDLYKNVMNEIQQALISLAFSSVESSRLLAMEQDMDVSLVDDPEGEEDDNWRDTSTAENTLMNPVITITIKEEEEIYDIDCHKAERRDSSTSSTEHGSIDHNESPSFKEEMSTVFAEQNETERRDGVSNSPDDRTMSRKRRNRAPAKCKEKTMADETSLLKVSSNLPQNSEIPLLPKSQLRAQTKDNLKAETQTQCEDGLNHPECSDLLETTQKVEKAATYGESETDVKTINLFVSQQGKHRNWIRYTCTECPRTFTQKRDLIIHERLHMEDRHEDKEWETHFSETGQTFRQQRNTTDDRTYQCTECGKSFSDKESVIRHQRIHMVVSGKPYQCADCGKAFSQKSNLIIHERIHTGERPYPCSECGKRFSQKGSLIVHMRTHMVEKPYQCVLCDRGFSQKGDLTIHQRTHTGERPYQCAECKKSFSRKLSLIRHARIHTGEKPYQCTKCKKRFSRKYHLTQHESLH